ncbi:MAG: hypothetical protein AABX51_07920, partial [Nanoarchaeota archaeon]
MRQLGKYKSTLLRHKLLIIFILALTIFGGAAYYFKFVAASNVLPSNLAVTVCCQSLVVSPECSDGKDNDGDSKVDYPSDTDCLSSSDNTEKPDPCESSSSCGDCALQAGCGWCKKTNSCLKGDQFGSETYECHFLDGPSGRAVPDWDWVWGKAWCPASTKPNCPYACASDYVCAANGGTVQGSYSCEDYSIPPFTVGQSCCKLGTYQNEKTKSFVYLATTNSIETIYQLEHPGLFGMDITNFYVLAVTLPKLADLQEDITGYNLLMQGLQGGRNVEQTLNFYKSFVDSSGNLNSAGRNYLDQKYVATLNKFNQEVGKNLEECDVRSASNQIDGNTCTPLYFLSEGMIDRMNALKSKEESVIKNVIYADDGHFNGIFNSFKEFDRKSAQGLDTREEESAIFYYLGEKFRGKSDAKAVEMFTYATDHYPGTFYQPLALDAKNNLESTLHRAAYVYVAPFLVGFVGVENILPFPNLPGKGRLAALLGRLPAIREIIDREGVTAFKSALRTTEIISEEHIDEFVELGLKFEAKTITEDEKKRLAALMLTDTLRRDARVSISGATSQDITYISNTLDKSEVDTWGDIIKNMGITNDISEINVFKLSDQGVEKTVYKATVNIADESPKYFVIKTPKNTPISQQEFFTTEQLG